MTITEINEIACQIIAFAGDSKSSSMEAMDYAEHGDFEGAEQHLQDSEAAIVKAHEIHTQLLVLEARQQEFAMTMMLMHASNHLTGAEVSREFAMRIVRILKTMPEKEVKK